MIVRIKQISAKIINSENAEEGRYKFAQVSIQHTTSSGIYLHQCGGSIIAPDIILSAAHCKNLVDRIRVDVFDLSSVDTNNATYAVKSVTAHPQNNQTLFSYDFLIVHINQAIPDIAPIRLNNISAIPNESENLTVVGWGATTVKTENTSAVYPTILQKGYVNALTNKRCEATLINGLSLYEGEIFDDMLCAEGEVRCCDGTFVAQGEYYIVSLTRYTFSYIFHFLNKRESMHVLEIPVVHYLLIV
jgi:secreted trypsin-like serine protease